MGYLDLLRGKHCNGIIERFVAALLETEAGFRCE
jgi:hypothetical protein